MQTHKSYINFVNEKAKYEIENAQIIHDAFIEKAIDELDRHDISSKFYNGIEEVYSAIDYKLNGGSSTAKKLLEIAKSDFATINYYGILADLGSFDYKQIAEILKNDVKEYEAYKTKDNRKNRQEKYYAKYPEKRPVKEETEIENN